MMSDIPENPLEEQYFRRRPALIGHRTELTTLLSAWARARAGRPTLTTLTGEAGLGKTRLLEELLVTAEADGAIVLQARALDLTGHRPSLQLWHDAIGSLDPALRRDLASLTHAARTPARTRRDTRSRPSIQRLGPLVTALAGLAAPHGLLVVLQDLQWADGPSLDLITFAVSRLISRIHGPSRRPRLLVALSGRPAPEGSAWDRCLADLRRDPRCVHQRLTGLSRDEIERIVAAETGAAPDPAVGAWYHALSEGNPFYALELARARALPPTLPETVRDLALTRLREVSEPARRLVRAIVTGDGPGPPGPALAEAVGANLVRIDPATGTLEVRPRILRQALYESTPAAQRPRDPENRPPAGPLTPREQQVLARLAEGRSNRQIATTLFITEGTAAVHVSRILAKLQANSRTEAVAVAHRLGLLGDG